MERKLRYIEAEVKKDGVPIPDDLKELPRAPNPREIIDLEVFSLYYSSSGCDCSSCNRLISGEDRENGERHPRAEPERCQPQEQLPRADGTAPRAREDPGVFHRGS